MSVFEPLLCHAERKRDRLVTDMVGKRHSTQTKPGKKKLASFVFVLHNGGVPLVDPLEENGRAIAQDYWDRTFDLQLHKLSEDFLEFFPSPLS